MENRFKTRVWDEFNKIMIYPDGNGYFKFREHDCVLDGNGKLFRLYDNEDCDEYFLMQSTGLTDKNGKEIFESDIISTPNGDLLVICWNEEELQYCAISIKKINRDRTLVGSTFYQVFIKSKIIIHNELQYAISFGRIIGNIYKNSELIGE